MTATTSLNGRWELMLPDHRRRQWADWDRRLGGWERERLGDMSARLRPGMTVYDVGAETGDLSALWASWGCDVVLFEPSAGFWPTIRETFDLNGLEPGGAWVGFCGERTAGLAHHVGPGEWPIPVWEPADDDPGFCHLNERLDIAVLAIDDAPRLLGCGPPDAITIDVEGAELAVLRGAERTLRDVHPVVWVSIHRQFMADRYGHHPADVNRFMADLGYRATWLADDHETHVRFEPA